MVTGCSDVNGYPSSHTTQAQSSNAELATSVHSATVGITVDGRTLLEEISKWPDHTGRALEALTVKRSGEAH